jgi:hypothetical protein
MAEAAFARPDEPDISFVPETEADLVWALKSWRWRVFSGHLYKVMLKSDSEDDPGIVVPFRPNRHQQRFLSRLHTRNVILKARQLGFTTLIAILWLDHALFNADQRVGIIAHTIEAAEEIFRDKVRFVYDRLPDGVRAMFPLSEANKSTLKFAHNNSMVRVSVSMRSGTIHRLHVSEMGKVAAKFPQKAVEIVTGSLPAVPQDGIAIIESTAEGRDGEFYRIATRAEKRTQTAEIVPLKPKEFAFHFFAWWEAPEYEADPRSVVLTEEDHEYFDGIEIAMDTLISNRKRAWYVLTRDSEFGGDPTMMWREYPSTPEECWQQSTKGRIFAPQLRVARVGGRIKPFIERDPYVPCWTAWDIGSRDGTGIWVGQTIGEIDRMLHYLEGWQLGFGHFVDQLSALGITFSAMVLPHDAAHKRQTESGIVSAEMLLDQLRPDWSWYVIPATPTKATSINLARKWFSRVEFSERGCKAGIEHLSNYQWRWNTAAGAFAEEVLKNEATECADAFQQYAMAREMGLLGGSGRFTSRPRRRVSGQAA